MIRRALDRLGEALLRGPHREFVLGDLEEGYERVASARGRLAATAWYIAMAFVSAYHLRAGGDRREYRRARRSSWFSEGLLDLRHGARFVVRRPGTAFIAFLVVALGVGVATFAFGVHYGMFVRGLPVDHPERMVDVTSTMPEAGVTSAGMSIDDFDDLRAAQTTMDDLAAWARTEVNVSSDGAPPERVNARLASASLFRLLEMHPMHGRLLTQTDESPEAPLAVVLSEPLWQRRFGGAPDAVGQTLRVNGEPAVIAGVLPAGVGFPAGGYPLIYIPVRSTLPTPDRRAERDYWVLGRLRASASIADADRELRTLAGRLAQSYPGTNAGVSARVVSFIDGQGPFAGRALLNLTAALMLVIAIANTTNLFLVHMLARNRELRMRLALGAGPWRVIRHAVGEAFIPIAAGALGGTFIASIALQWYGNRPLAAWEAYRIEAPHVLFIAALATAAILIVGTIAGITALRRNRSLSLSHGSRGNTRRDFSRLGYALVVGEIAFGGALLFVAGLMVKTAVNLRTVDYGFAIEDVVTGRVIVDSARYRTPEERLAFWSTFRRRVRALPGVRSVALATQLPMIRYHGWTSFQLDGEPPASAAEFPGANHSAVSPEFFDTYEKMLIRGRPFTEADGPDAEPVVIVNDDFVRKFFPDGKALGRRIRLGGPESEQPWMRVIGIAPHMWMDTDVDRFPEGLYVPLAQHDPASASIAVRVVGAPEDYVSPLRAVLQRLDPELPLADVMTMSELIHMRTTSYRRNGPRYTFLGAAALILSAVGLYA